MGLKEKLTEMKTSAAAITAILGLAGSIVAGVIWVDDRYAKADTVVELDKRLTKAELKDQLRAALEEVYFLRSQTRKYPDDQQIKDQLKEAEEQVDEIKRQLREVN